MSRTNLTKPIALALTLGIVLTASAVHATFDDVPEDHYAQSEIAYLRQIGVIKGYDGTIYGPTDTVTRAQTALIVAGAWQHVGHDCAYGSAMFDDVPDGYYAEHAINCVHGSGIIVGTTDTTFEPAGHVTRGQVAVIAVRMWTKAGRTCSTPASMPYDDVADDILSSVECLVSLDAVHSNTANLYRPDEPATRGYVAFVIARLVQNLAQGTQPDSNGTDGNTPPATQGTTPTTRGTTTTTQAPDPIN